MIEKPIIVTSYNKPDLDGTASAIGYAEFLRKKNFSAIAILGKPVTEAKFLLHKIDHDIPTGKIGHDSKIILVDSSTTFGLSHDINYQNVIEIIDHRLHNRTEAFPNAKIQIELVGAAATLVAEKFFNNDLLPSKKVAWLLYGAIISNTLNFKANVTTDRDRKMAEWLKKIGEVEDNLVEEMFVWKSTAILENIEESMREELARNEIKGETFAIIQLEMHDTQKLLSKIDEIFSIFAQFRKENKINKIFLSAVDLKENRNLFITDQPQTRKIISAIFNINFEGNYAIHQGLIMRKEIWPKLIEYLERK